MVKESSAWLYKNEVELNSYGKERDSSFSNGGHGEESGPGNVFLVAAGPGDPEFLTLKAVKVIRTLTFCCMIVELLVTSYHRVLKVFGMGGKEMDFLQQKGIQVKVIPEPQDLADKVVREELVSPTLIIIGKVVALSPLWPLSFKEEHPRFNSINLVYATELLLYWKPLLNRLLIMMVSIHKKGNERAKGSCSVLHLTGLVSNSKQSTMMYVCREQAFGLFKSYLHCDWIDLRGRDALLALLEHPKLVSASNSFKAMQEVTFSASKESALQGRWVYIFQREFATVDPARIDDGWILYLRLSFAIAPSLAYNFVGTDEATTCVGLVIRNQRNGMTSVAHMDSTKVVDIGLTQMLSLVADQNFDVDLDVHLIGGFEDVLPKQANDSTRSKTQSKVNGYSFPLCTKIIETLGKRQEKFHIQTLFVLEHNTKRDSRGNAYPVFNGFLVKTSSGSIIPASFDRTMRCPDEIVRRIRVTASYEDPYWNGKLLETYDTQTDRFVIAPCSWTLWQVHAALTLENFSDEEILLHCSTSPSAEGLDFVDNLRRQWDYLIKKPDWNLTFPLRRPRVFEWTTDGSWKRCLFSPQGSWNEARDISIGSSDRSAL
ncbi:unnamed protein product [Dovyalis caffra]|uniref:Protein N-terminal asparagine amidohydrolase n=1 Tax=Dovyalis caffra TaxID=77055 RepID=A0AAV1RBT7_9ROSI|nr:unnamed protein product [Dovyalis caffra]